MLYCDMIVCYVVSCHVMQLCYRLSNQCNS